MHCQPFEQVDRPEFWELLTYAQHPAPDLKIPHRDAVRRHIMKMGEDSVESTKKMFEVRIESYDCSLYVSFFIYRLMFPERSAYRLMLGLQATIMLSSLLLHIMWTVTEIYIYNLFYLLVI